MARMPQPCSGLAPEEMSDILRVRPQGALCNYLAWNKTVQTLDRVLSVARRPGRCPHETCAGSRLRLLSAEAQSIALPHSTYG